MNDTKADLKLRIAKLKDELVKLRRYSFASFIVFVALVYGLVLFKVNSLSHAEPSAQAVSSQVKAIGAPRIDKKVVKQLESLQDNSVSVQALFEEARSNPFE
jgi:hypothetical protein